MRASGSWGKIAQRILGLSPFQVGPNTLTEGGLIQSGEDRAEWEAGQEGRSPQHTLKEGAARSDAALGIREYAEFIDAPESRIFVCLHAPLQDPVGLVVICSPIQAEFEKNYRREFLLARSLAAVGLAALRFHYRGSGNSDGEAADATLETMHADAVTAVEWLIERTGVSDVGFVGTRWGGLVAAEAAARYNRAPLALWEPVLDPARYFRDALRSRLMRDLKYGATNRLSSAALRSELERTGFVDLLGYGIYRALYNDAMGRLLVNALAGEPRPVLIVQISPETDLRGDLATLVAGLKGRGFPMTAEVIADKEEAWWFADGRGEAAEARPGAKALVSITSQWFVSRFDEERR
jgi:pimeloyl-ACP methyl ester carboxylesterase